ncbi:MAG: hypothetical protein ACFFFB_11525 [Candidatus Heimdallarchaeota archaeon]
MVLNDSDRAILSFSTPVDPQTEVEWMVKDLNKFLLSLNKIYDLILAALTKINNDTHYFLEYVHFKQDIKPIKKSKDSKEIEKEKMKESKQDSETKIKTKWDLNDVLKEYFPSKKKVQKRILSLEKFEKIYKNLDKYTPKTEFLYVRKIRIGSPSEINVIGIGDILKSIFSLIEKVPELLSKRDFEDIERLLQLERENAMFKENYPAEKRLVEPLLEWGQKIIMTRLIKKISKKISKLRKSAKKHNISDIKLISLSDEILGRFSV